MSCLVTAGGCLDCGAGKMFSLCINDRTSALTVPGLELIRQNTIVIMEWGWHVCFTELISGA